MAAIDDFRRHQSYNSLPAGFAATLVGVDSAALARAVETGDNISLPPAAITALNAALGTAKTADQYGSDIRRRGTR